MRSCLPRVLMMSLAIALALVAQAAVAQNPADALSATPPEPAKPVKDRGDGASTPSVRALDPSEALSATPPVAEKPQKLTDPDFDRPSARAAEPVFLRFPVKLQVEPRG